MSAHKTITLRIDEDRAADLEAVAAANGDSVNKTLTQAVDDLITTSKKDKEFQKRVRAIMERNQNGLARLAE